MKRISIKHWWAGGVLVVLAAFIVGVYLSPVGAEPASDDPNPIVATSTVPLIQGKGSTIEIETLYEIVPSSESTFYVSSTLGSATKPTSGEWVYLSTIRRYISLPSDVVWAGTVITASCPGRHVPTPLWSFTGGGVSRLESTSPATSTARRALKLYSHSSRRMNSEPTTNPGTDSRPPS